MTDGKWILFRATNFHVQLAPSGQKSKVTPLLFVYMGLYLYPLSQACAYDVMSKKAIDFFSQMKMPAFCKKREFLEAMSQRVSDIESDCYHMLAFRSTTHPSVPPSKDIIRFVHDFLLNRTIRSSIYSKWPSQAANFIPWTVSCLTNRWNVHKEAQFYICFCASCRNASFWCGNKGLARSSRKMFCDWLIMTMTKE
jgi:hypothetical protein